MRTRTKISVSIAAMALLVPTIAGAASLEPVRTKTGREYIGSPGVFKGKTILAWTTSERSKVTVYVEPAGKPRKTVNDPKKTFAWSGSFAASREDGKLILQIARLRGKQGSDVQLWTYRTGRFTQPPKGINNGAWQWGPAYDVAGGKQWVLYGENRFAKPSSPWKVLLWDPVAKKKRLLGEVRNACKCITPGTLVYPWVTWDSWTRGKGFDAWRYNIETKERKKITVPGPAKQYEYSPASTTDGTTYLVRSGDRCGKAVSIWRVGPDGDRQRLIKLPAGSDADSLQVLEHDDEQDLYLTKHRCKPWKAGVYVMRNVGAPIETRRTLEPVGHQANNEAGNPWRGAGGAGPARRAPVGSTPGSLTGTE